MLCCRNSPQSITSFSPQSSIATIPSDMLTTSELSKQSEISQPVPIASPYSLAIKNDVAAKNQDQIGEEIAVICNVKADAPLLEVPRPVAAKQPHVRTEGITRKFDCSSEQIQIPSEQKTVRTGSRQASSLNETKCPIGVLDTERSASSSAKDAFKTSAEISFQRAVHRNEENRSGVSKISEQEIELARIVQLGQRQSKAQQPLKSALALAKK